MASENELLQYEKTGQLLEKNCNNNLVDRKRKNKFFPKNV